jgi:hypothetical protein
MEPSEFFVLIHHYSVAVLTAQLTGLGTPDFQELQANVGLINLKHFVNNWIPVIVCGTPE